MQLLRSPQFETQLGIMCGSNLCKQFSTSCENDTEALHKSCLGLCLGLSFCLSDSVAPEFASVSLHQKTDVHA